MTKKKITFGSILIGLLTFGLLGFSIYSLLVRLGLMTNSSVVRMVFIIIGCILGIILGIKYPITTEALSFAITSLIFVQAIWDSTYDIVGGVLDPRVLVGSIAVGIFILNVFTGELKRGTAKRQIRRTLGVK